MSDHTLGAQLGLCDLLVAGLAGGAVRGGGLDDYGIDGVRIEAVLAHGGTGC